MRDAPDRGPAPVVYDRFAAVAFERIGAHMRPALVLLVVAQFAVVPKRRMRPEEREDAAKQQQHELGREPGVGITTEVFVVGVRLELHEARRRVEMALLAGLQAVVRMHARCRIVHALDRVAAVAVEALGGIGEAQRVDLTVVGPHVGLQLLVVAIAAVLGDQQPGRVERRVLDVVRGVAVRADRRFRIAVLQRLLAVHRGLVGLELLGVARAAGIRQIEPPPVPVGAALRIDVVGFVAIVAGGVGARLIFLVGLRVDRLHVAADHVDDAAQLGDFVGLVLVLRVFQQILMAIDAADLHLDLFVRNLGDVGVALDALPLAVHAAQEAVFQHHRETRLARASVAGANPSWP